MLAILFLEWLLLVSIVQTSDNMLVDTVDVGKFPQNVAITPDGNFAYVTNSGSNNVSLIQIGTRMVVDTVRVGKYPTGVAITIGGSENPGPMVPPGNESTKTGGGCSIASSTYSNTSLPAYLLIPAFILIARLWRRRTNKKHM